MLTATQIKQLVTKGFDKKRKEYASGVISTLTYLAKISTNSLELTTIYEQAKLLREPDSLVREIALNKFTKTDILVDIVNPKSNLFTTLPLLNPKFRTIPNRVDLVVDLFNQDKREVASFISNWELTDLKQIADKVNEQSLVRLFSSDRAQTELVEYILKKDIISSKYAHRLADANLPNWTFEELLELSPKTLEITKAFNLNRDQYIISELFSNKALSTKTINAWADLNPNNCFIAIKYHFATNHIAYKLIDLFELVLSIGGNLNTEQKVCLQTLVTNYQRFNLLKLKKSYRDRLAKLLVYHADKHKLLNNERTLESSLSLILTLSDTELLKLPGTAKESLGNLICKSYLHKDYLTKLTTNLILDCLTQVDVSFIERFSKDLADSYYYRNFPDNIKTQEVYQLLLQRLPEDSKYKCQLQNYLKL